VGSYLAALALFVAGVAVVPRSRPAVLLLGFLAYYVLLHVASHGYPRYRLPAMPVLFLVGACGWALGRSPERPPLSRARKAATAAVALALALSVGPSLVFWLTEPWPPPSWTWTQESGMQEGPP
jgi:uncharacterized membrane protein AbrB (regulator of aidB expression)